jgi:hypothetical protein
MLQAGLGFSVIAAALTGIPFAVGIGVSIGFVGQKLIPLLGRYVMVLGVALLCLSLAVEAWLVLHFGLDLSPWYLAPALLFAGLGTGMIMSPMFSVVLSEVDVQHAGSASGIMNAIQQVGGAIGIALIGVVFFGLINHGAAAQAAKAEPQLRRDLTAAHLPVEAQDHIVQQFITCFSDRSSQKDASATPRSCQPEAFTPVGTRSNDQPVAQQQATTKAISDSLQSAGKTANADNFAHAFGWGIGFEIAAMLVVGGLAFLLPRHLKTPSMKMAA